MTVEHFCISENTRKQNYSWIILRSISKGDVKWCKRDRAKS